MARAKPARRSVETKKSGRKAGSAAERSRPRLFLVSPEDMAPTRLHEILSAALQAGDAAALLIAGDDRHQLRPRAEAVLPLGQAHNLAVLLNDCPELAAELGADGVQIAADLARYRHARGILGNDRIVGAFCGRSRHAAMELGEAGAEYVAFDEAAPWVENGTEPFSLLGWWAQVFEVPCVAFAPASEADLRRHVSLGVEFIRPADDMWRSPNAARDTIGRFNAVIDEVLRHEA
ncbi:thiamine phosphate synthase [Rhodoligotrophos defluvii]|uniref:thiamine phosphate synthase n=1 Tax=Rhodoligotrophos defluvii TaxID=2561934 RepID=UPI0010C9B7E0|nr:thiamine phosphate synthase [Rhodoligotrophos defluvii]